MGKVLYFLVFMAVIAQIYTLPAPAQDDAAANGVGDKIKQGEDKAVKTAGSAGGIPESALGSSGMIAPFLKLPETALNGGEKVMKGVMGILM